MSFSGDVKAELCRVGINPCCALAELYGILLFASIFSPREIRILTKNAGLFKRIEKLSAAALPISLPGKRYPPARAGVQFTCPAERKSRRYTKCLNMI